VVSLLALETMISLTGLPLLVLIYSISKAGEMSAACGVVSVPSSKALWFLFFHSEAFLVSRSYFPSLVSLASPVRNASLFGNALSSILHQSITFFLFFELSVIGFTVVLFARSVLTNRTVTMIELIPNGLRKVMVPLCH
jgi:hypothetical protein